MQLYISNLVNYFVYNYSKYIDNILRFNFVSLFNY